MPTRQSHTLPSRTSRHTCQNLSMCVTAVLQDKIELKKISSPSENKKYATSQPDTTNTLTVKRNNDNGLQQR